MKYCEERNLAEVRAKLAEVRKNVRSALRDMTGEENHDNRLMIKGKLDEVANRVRQHEAEIKDHCDGKRPL